MDSMIIALKINVGEEITMMIYPSGYRSLGTADIPKPKEGFLEESYGRLSPKVLRQIRRTVTREITDMHTICTSDPPVQHQSR